MLPQPFEPESIIRSKTKIWVFLVVWDDNIDHFLAYSTRLGELLKDVYGAERVDIAQIPWEDSTKALTEYCKSIRQSAEDHKPDLVIFGYKGHGLPMPKGGDAKRLKLEG